MRNINDNHNHYIISSLVIFLGLLAVVQCFPVPVLEADEKPDFKDEMKYPNGTVVGKYAYTDKEGNPIQVKYYADDSSYGVELNSVKIVSNNPDASSKQFKYDTFVKGTEPLLDTSSNLLESFKYPTSKKNEHDSLEFLKDSKNQHNNDHHKVTPDYEIYLQNDLAAPKKINKERIRVYNNFEKDKRKARNTYSYDAAQFCDQF